MASGSTRGVKIAGIEFNTMADANIALEPRVDKEAMPHSGGNLMKETLVPGSATAVKLKVTPAEYDILKNLSDDPNDVSLSYTMRDGSVFRTQGGVKLGPFQSEDFSCEVEFLTSTGEWENFSAT